MVHIDRQCLFGSGLITEAGSSVAFARRSKYLYAYLYYLVLKCHFSVGVAKANEALIFGRKKEAQELLECGFYK